MNLYVATQFPDKLLARMAMKFFQENGHEITEDWTVHEETEDENVLRREAIKDLEGVKRADALVVLLPIRLGAAGELAAALILGIPVFLVGDAKRWFNMKNVFFHHPLVTKVKTKEEVLPFLTKLQSVKSALPQKMRELYDI